MIATKSWVIDLLKKFKNKAIEDDTFGGKKQIIDNSFGVSSDSSRPAHAGNTFTLFESDGYYKKLTFLCGTPGQSTYATYYVDGEVLINGKSITSGMGAFKAYGNGFMTYVIFAKDIKPGDAIQIHCNSTNWSTATYNYQCILE